MSLKADIIGQLDKLIAEGQRLVDSFTYGHMGALLSGCPETEFRAFYTAAFAAVKRIAGADSEYYHSIPKVDRLAPLAKPGYDSPAIHSPLGALKALRDAVDDDLLVSLESRLRGNIHDDFLVQAKELLDAGYHVAAMVLVGGVLEDHLHKMATSRSLSWPGNGSISKYNDLLSNAVYPQAIWRRIQSIADVRNEAAHGNGTNVNPDDVTDALSFTHRCLADYPS